MNTVLVVTFAWSLVAAVAVIWRLFFRCIHAWEFVDKTQLPSKLEEMSKHWKPAQMMIHQTLEAAKVCATIVV